MLIMLLIVALVFSLGTLSLSSPIANDGCTADNSIWFVFDSYPCSKLQDPTDKLGIYRTRKERCEDPLTDCCVTCEKVKQEYACEDVHNGISLADSTYECAKLNDVNDKLGIYNNRVSICKEKSTSCCVTCRDILPECTDMTSGAIFNNKAYDCTLLLDQTDLSGVYENRISVCADNDTQCCSTCKEVTRLSAIGPHCELTNTGVYIADGSYACANLLDVNDRLGIYQNRQRICSEKQTQCCMTCETVRQELGAAISSKGTERPTTPASTIPPKTIIIGNPSINKDCERNVWVAGGAYDCMYLTDTSNKYGIYQKRLEFCNTGEADCCITCNKIRQESAAATTAVEETEKPTTPSSPATTKKLVIGANPAIKDCERHVWIAGGAYDCSYLTDSSNKYGIYQNRRKFCNNGVADCCITCDRVRKESQKDVSITTESPKSKIYTTQDAASVCKDEWIYIYSQYLDCGRLVDRGNSYDIYRRRVELCQSDATKCCMTCKQVNQEAPPKPSGMKNMGENTVFKPQNNLQNHDINVARQSDINIRNSIASNQERLAEANRAIQEAFRNFFALLGQFRASAAQLTGGMINNRP